LGHGLHASTSRVLSASVADADDPCRQPGCKFCDIVAGELAAHVVLDQNGAVAFLDNRPLFPGHVLLIPRCHVDTFDDAPAEVAAELAVTAQRLSRAVQDATAAKGTFIATNVRVSQSVPHLHIHIVPRTKGDGLRGFFWPRNRYRNDEEAAAVAEAIRKALVAQAS
jgi:histidine triad (HIT) family protein